MPATLLARRNARLLSQFASPQPTGKSREAITKRSDARKSARLPLNANPGGGSRTSLGGLSPTTLISYDANNNVIAQCDANFVATHGLQYVVNWSSHAGSDTLCPATLGTTHETWDTSDTQHEPFGRLVAIYSPGGYRTSITYDANGLPTDVSGDTFAQADSTVVSPHQRLVYDNDGDLVCYSKFDEGSSRPAWWILQYDVLHRQTAGADPDDATLTSPFCSKTPGLPGSDIVTSTTYNADGSVASVQTPAERAGEVSTSFTYDADGDKLTETKHFGNQPGPTTNWYDGADRLVEVEEPYDAQTDLYAAPWLTRYLYDLSGNGSNTFAGQSFATHGGLYSTERYIPFGTISDLAWQRRPMLASRRQGAFLRKFTFTPPKKAKAGGQTTAMAALQRRLALVRSLAGSVPLASVNITQSWRQVSATALDPLGRTVAAMTFQPGSQSLSIARTAYDGANPGLPSSTTNALGDQITSAYDADGRATALSFAVGSAADGTAPTPDRTYTFDPDGHTVSITSTAFGTENYQYNQQGELISDRQPTGGSGIPSLGVTGKLSSPGTLDYTYYANGQRASVALAGGLQPSWNNQPISGSPLNIANSYSYAADGQVQTIQPNYAASKITFVYTAAGRKLSETDLTGSETFTYDAAGQTRSEAAPTATLQGFAYDDEGENLGYTAVAGPGCACSDTFRFQYTYTARGEVASDPWNSYRYADGVQIPPDQYDSYAIPGSQGLGVSFTETNDFDPLTGTIIGHEAYSGSTSSPPTYHLGVYFDAAGRQLGQDAMGYDWVGNICVCSGTSHQYDVENHTTYSNGTSYGWGPNGHPIFFGVYPSGVQSTVLNGSTIHWDGATPFYATDPIGNVLDVKLGAIADVVPTMNCTAQGDPNSGGQCLAGTWDTSDFTVWDRGPNGAVFGGHNATGSSIFYARIPYPNVQTAFDRAGTMESGGSLFTVGNNSPYFAEPFTPFGDRGGNYNGTLFYERTDGVTDGATTFQGVRTSDPTTGQWTTPDAFAGSISDPASQMPYMWDNNNPLSYADPSGFLTVEIFDSAFLYNLGGHAAMFITHGKGDSGTLYCLCGAKGGGASGPALIIIENTNLRSLTHGIGKGGAARYDSGLVFNTTKSQEKTIASMFKNYTGKYNVISHNCVGECILALHAAGVLTVWNNQDSPVPKIDEGPNAKPLTSIIQTLLQPEGD